MPNPDAIFRQAEKFRFSGQLMLFAANGNDEYMTKAVFPAMVCDAFALELFLKCVLSIESDRNIRHIHDLQKLFSKISPPNQNKIKAIFCDVVEDCMPVYIDAGQIPNFDYELSRSKDAFTQFRYVYEGIDNCYYSGSSITIATRLLILDMMPTYRQWTSGPDR